MVTTGTVAWCDHQAGHTRTEDLVFPPLQLARTTATYLIGGLLRNLRYLTSLDKLVDDAAEKFSLILFQCVCDSATANTKALPRLFSWLQARSEKCVGAFAPCLLHQMSRILVMNLERQSVSSLPFAKLFVFAFVSMCHLGEVYQSKRNHVATICY